MAFGSTANFTSDNPTFGHTIFWATIDGGTIGQPLREGTVAAGAASFQAEGVSMDDAGSLILFDTLENFNVGTSSNRKIYSTGRQ